MGFFNQLRVLLWKNFTLRIRQPLRIVVEVLWPLTLFLILVAVRQRDDIKENRPECHYKANAMPSAGVLPFLQTYVCNFRNPCSQITTEGGLGDSINSFNGSLLSDAVAELEKILQNGTEVAEIDHLIEDFELLQEFVQLLQNASTDLGSVVLSELILNETVFRNQLQDQNISLSSDALDTLLNASLSLRQFLEPFQTGNFDNFSNLTDFARLAQDLFELAVGTTVNETDLDNLLERSCDEELLLGVFEFSDEQAAIELQKEVCNLTTDELRQIVEDLAADVNRTRIIEEARRIITDVTGRTPHFDLEKYTTFRRISRDISQARSLLGVVAELQRLASEASSEINTTNILGSVGSLICGPGVDTIFLDDEDAEEMTQNLQTPGQGQPSEQTDEEKERKEKSKRKYLKNNVSEECAEQFANFDSQRWSRIIWRQLKPFVLGIIPYFPDSPAARKIITEARRTFDSIASFFAVTVDIETVIAEVENFLNDNSSASTRDLIRGFADSSACRILLETQLEADPNLCTSISDFLSSDNDTYTYRNAIDNLYKLLERFSPLLDCIVLDKFVGYDNEDDLIEDGLKRIENGTLWAAIVFTNIGVEQEEVPPLVKFKIRLDKDRVDSTKFIMDKYWRPGPRGRAIIDLKYFNFGFIYIQDMIEHAIIRLHTSLQQEPGVYSQQFPYPCWVRDKFLFAISRTLPLFMVISWIYTVAMIIKGVVYEKEMRLKEVMKMMGLGNAVHWLAWFINAFVMMIITVIIFVMVLRAGKVLEYTDPTVMFVFMLGFTVSTISQCFLISVFFNKANVAAVCGGFVYFVLYLPYTQLVQWEDHVTTSIKYLGCLSSNIAMGYGCNFLALYEEQAIGAQWSNIAESPIIDDEFSFQACIGMMFLDAVIYFILAWYIEAVFPGEYGIPRKWYFPVQKSYWLGDRYRKSDRSDVEIPIEDITNHSEDMEKEPKDMTVGVAVRNLKKIYNKGDKVAVDGLSINFYEGQITSFLGHNGAGKTTTMSILTGLFPPTSGNAYVYGKSVVTEMDQIRNSLGMCPQHNVLFDLLTVDEHVWFYAKLKGCDSKDVKVEQEKMITDVGLLKKRKEKSMNLSGGMKRKLSVAIAFVGGSRTVILDEPTAGVDPYARRAIWELLLKYRKGRTIILSTHHMDEADVLGDRIAIISQGRLCTIGSSLFLKNRFGSGYYLTLVREDKEEMDEDAESSRTSLLDSASVSSRPSTTNSVRTLVDVKPAMTSDVDEGYDEKNGSDKSDSPTPLPKFGAHKQNSLTGFSLPRLTAFVTKFVPGAELVEDNSMEVTFRLPEDDGHADRFQRLFSAFELTYRDMGVSSYGISDTSLEEVFLRVAEENSTDENDEKHRNKLEEMSEGGKYPRPVSKLSRRGSQLRTKTSLFNLSFGGRSRVDSMDRLTSDMDDDESIASEPAEDRGITETNFSGAGQSKVSGKMLVCRQMLALFIKRFHHVRRSKKGFVSEILLPAGFVCLAMVLSFILPPFSQMPALELQPWMYEPKKGDSSLNTFYSNNRPYDPTAQAMEKTLLSQTFFGNRCMNDSVYEISGKSCLSEQKSKWTKQNPAGDIKDYPTCSCSSGFQRCKKGAGGPKPSRRKIDTNDNFYNVTGRNISHWLVKTMDKYQKRRYGGFSLGEYSQLGDVNMTEVAASLNSLVRAANNNNSFFSGTERLWQDLEDALKFAFVGNNVKFWFNNKGWAASVSYMNAINNVILRSFLPAGKDPKDYGIVAINHPMNLTSEQLSEATLYRSFVDLIVAVCVIFAMSFVPASFVLFLIEERMSNSKHLQFVSGINPTIYWLANSLWDLINYSIPALLCIFIFLAFQKDSYVSAKNLPCLFALLFLYGWAITPMMYPFSRLFSVPSSAFVALSCVNVFLGTVSTLSTFILEVLAQEDPELEDINVILKQVFLVLPHYCLGRGLIDMAAKNLEAKVFARLGEDIEYDLFAWNLVGRNLFAMVMVGLFFHILNLLIEYKFFLSWLCVSHNVKSKKKTEDIDVVREKQKVLSGAANESVMRLEGLSKVYWTPGRKGKMTAVDHLYVGVPKGQCFGLLGVNGAGKTTTFKMLTGDVSVSEGDAYINGMSIRTDMVKVRQLMGYCPQFDALDPLLTGRETLEFYARIRGIPASEVKSVAEWAISRLGLTNWADKISSNYSGGNKRKLSTAIALIGNPPIIFLDEPTTGMDPKARRFLWNCINSIIKTGRSVILTSHSMEECEALCSRLAIMVNGSFQCLGSIQHLKNRFGNGYTVILRVSGQNPDLSDVMNYITSIFPSAKLREKHHNMLQYQLGTEDLSLSKLFEGMEEAKRQYNVEDYSVSQTTLDQVFINFAKRQSDLKDDEMEEVDTEPNDDWMDDNASNVFNADSLSTGGPSEVDEQSLAGSTLELIRPASGRSYRGATGKQAPPHDGLSNVSVA